MSVTIPRASAPLQVLRPQSFNELAQFASMAAKSQMVPASMRGKPEDIMLAVQMGSEVGLSPMQAIQNIAVINGKPALWGDAMPGLCRASAVCQDIVERFEGEGDKLTAVCVAKRHGSEPVTATFSVEDAKKAGLWNKAGPWTQYPKRMLQMRARGFALRDAFPDVLRGLISAEEAGDIPDTFSGTTINGEPSLKTREAINAAVPLAGQPANPDLEGDGIPALDPAPKRPTSREWLDALEAELKAAADGDVVDEIIARADVQKALDKLSNGAKDRLNTMIKAALDRTGEEMPPVEEAA